MRALTQAAAKEYARSGITVNAYCPGIVGTDMWVEIDERFSEITGAPKGETYKKYVDAIALGRTQTPEDVATLVAFLASGDFDYITDQSILTDGGIVPLKQARKAGLMPWRCSGAGPDVIDTGTMKPADASTSSTSDARTAAQDKDKDHGHEDNR